MDPGTGPDDDDDTFATDESAKEPAPPDEDMLTAESDEPEAADELTPPLSESDPLPEPRALLALHTVPLAQYVLVCLLKLVFELRHRPSRILLDPGVFGLPPTLPAPVSQIYAPGNQR